MYYPGVPLRFLHFHLVEKYFVHFSDDCFSKIKIFFFKFLNLSWLMSGSSQLDDTVYKLLLVTVFKFHAHKFSSPELQQSYIL